MEFVEFIAVELYYPYLARVQFTARKCKVFIFRVLQPINLITHKKIKKNY